jgi:hypothetical protein
MNEAFLSFVWKYRLYDTNLQTTSGEPVTVIKTGEQHKNSGPDFFNARIRIGETLWAGNVEIHVKASDWYRHHHQSNQAYSNVILHVVYEADSIIVVNDTSSIPTVSLNNCIDELVYQRYRKLTASDLKIPCSRHMKDIPPTIMISWLDRMLVERLETKSAGIEHALLANNGDWEDAFYQMLARNFGFGINGEPFEMLARVLPRHIIRRHADDPLQVEALLFGQAGFLDSDFKDEYPLKLKHEFEFLRKKYLLEPMQKHHWKFLRMRPVNFPTIRISQFASLIVRYGTLFNSIRNTTTMDEITDMFEVKTSSYWNDHFIFDKLTKFAPRFLGLDSARNIIINTIAPYLFYYGKNRGDGLSCEKSFSLLQSLPSESNSILNQWKELGIKADNAFEGQALLHLYKNYCSHKNCLNCSIGKSILKISSNPDL